MAVLASTGVASDATQTNPVERGRNGGSERQHRSLSAERREHRELQGRGVREGLVQDGEPAAQESVAAPAGAGLRADSATAGANDSVMLVLKLRAPTNVRAFSYNSYFLSAEYPEYVCSTYNDQFVALVNTPSGTPSPIPNPVDKNLSTYIQGGSRMAHRHQRGEGDEPFLGVRPRG